jgi:cell division septum initiation protein DivIVA
MSTFEPEETSATDEGTSIPEPTFSTTWRGYDPGQVTGYVKGVAARARILEERTRELEAEVEQLRKQSGRPGTGPLPPAPSDPFEAVSDRVTEMMRTFDKDVEQMRSDAAEEARRIVEQAQAEDEVIRQAIEERRSAAEAEVEELLTRARAEADRVSVDAQAKAEDVRERAERALDDARARAEAMISDLETRRRSLIDEIRSLHDRMLDSAKQLRPVLDDEPAADDVVVREGGVAVAEGSTESSQAGGP